MLGITGYLHPFESVLNQNKENLLVGWITQFLIGVSRDLKGLMTESLVVMKNNQVESSSRKTDSISLNKSV